MTAGILASGNLAWCWGNDRYPTPPRSAAAYGGTLTAPAHMRPFGVYSGYFTDPDGHMFEIAWNSNE